MAIWLRQLECELQVDFADSLASVAAALERSAYDLIMIDLGMPGMQGVVSIQQVCSQAGGVPLLVVSADERPQVIRHCIDAGAAGYVTKSSPGGQILQAVRELLAGGCYAPVGYRHQESPLQSLSDKQKRILACLAEGLSNRAIAERMCLSEGTVKQYVTRILQTLDVDNRTQAGLKAKELLGIDGR